MVSAEVSPIQNFSGEKFLGGVSIDLTLRYQADERLRASEKLLRLLMETASDAIVAADSEGRILSWNQAAQKMFGKSEAEVLGQPLSSLMTEEGRRLADAVIQTKSGDRTIVIPGRRHDGQVAFLELSRSTWERNGRSFVTAIMRDVTERKKLEEQLRLSEAQMRMTLDAAFDAVPQIVWTAKPGWNAFVL